MEDQYVPVPKDNVYFFSEEGCRSATNPGNISEYFHKPNVAVNPDLSRVVGVPREFWKLEDGVVLPMNQAERNNSRLITNRKLKEELDRKIAAAKALEDFVEEKIQVVAKENAHRNRKYYLLIGSVLVAAIAVICKLKGVI